MRRILYKSFSHLRADRLLWGASGSRLRILCYHGVCEDHTAGEPWMPGYFVTESAFEKQLQYLKECAHVLPLSEAVVRLRDGSLPDRSVCLTFDDGYANNLSLAYSLLRTYGMPATIFLSSSYIENGELYPFLKLQLIRLSGCAGDSRPPTYKTESIDTIAGWVNQWWPAISGTLTTDQHRILRPLTVQELGTADPGLIEFGAHTHTHCILRNETPERRREELQLSIRKVSEWTGRPVTLFSYPNGELGDFGELDKQTLRAEAIAAAVTGIHGSNTGASDPLELKRFPVGLFHDDDGFRAEVTGLRTMLLSGGRGLRS